MKDKFKILIKYKINIIILVVLIIFILTTIIYKITAKQNQISINNQIIKSRVILFPDKNLEKLIRDNINLPTGNILKGDVDKITTLDGASKHIINLSGIENLTNLTSLYLSQNPINNIEPLKTLNNLNQLDLVGVKIIQTDDTYILSLRKAIPKCYIYK